MSRLTLHLFGIPRIALDDSPIPMRLRKATALLVYLALNPQAHGRDKLATLFYPGFGQSDALGNLRRTLSTLNKAIGNEWLESDRQSIALHARDSVWVDVVHFRGLVEQGRRHEHPAGSVCHQCLDTLEEAVALYEDDFLAGFTLPDCPEFDAWQDHQGAELRQLLGSALERLAQGYAVQGNSAEAVAHAQRRAGLDPLDEAAQRSLMTVYATFGQKAAALRQYEECARLLREELDASPSEETEALHGAIQRDDVAAQQAIAPPPPSPEHSTAESPSRAVSPRHNLPAQTTPFVGREEEVAELTRLFADPNTRLVTILGPGGMGKTRLAEETAAALLSEYAQGVYFVELAPLSQTDDIPAAVADALSFSLQPGGSSPQEQLLEYLAVRQMLLVLDNFEHLLDGAAFVNVLLQATPGIKLLVTSRRRLQLSGETVFALDGMHFPDWETPEDALEYSAVRLFVESAQRVRPGYELNAANIQYVARICRLVHGMPLGILLAASWVGLLSAQEIAGEISRSLDFLASELRDMPERQRSIRAVFDSSWRRLGAAEQAVFMRLAVFRGGMTREAAQTVAQASLPILSSLVNGSLLRRDRSGRYQVHDLLRQYADEELRAAGELDAARDAHCGCFVQFLQARDSGLKGGRQLAALQEIEADWENVRAAWQWAIARRDHAAIDQALEGVYWFCIMRSRLQAGQDLLRSAREGLAPASDEDPHPVWGRLMARAMKTNIRYLEPLDEIKERIKTALAMAEARGDERETAFCWWAMGLAFTSVEDSLQALPYYEKSLEIYKRLSDPFYLAWSLYYAGRGRNNASSAGGDALEQSLEIRRKIGDRIGVAYSLHEIGTYLLLDGRLAASKPYLEESYAIQAEMGNRQGMAENLAGLTGFALYSNDLDLAKSRALEMREIADDMNSPRHKGIAEVHLARLAYAKNDLAGSRHHYEQALASCSEYEYNVMSNSEYGLSLIASAEGDHQSARRHLRRCLEYGSGQPLFLRRYYFTQLADYILQAAMVLAHAGQLEWATSLLAFAFSQAITIEPRADQLKSELEAGLPPDRFAAAWASGQSLQLDDVIDDLLAELAE